MTVTKKKKHEILSTIQKWLNLGWAQEISNMIFDSFKGKTILKKLGLKKIFRQQTDT